MKQKISIYIGISVCLFLLAGLALSGKFPPQFGVVNNPSAKEILEGNPDADIIQMGGLVYSNAAEEEWLVEMEYQLGEQINEIRKQTKQTWFYRNMFATRLPNGTPIYVPKGIEYNENEPPNIILAKIDEKIMVYKLLVEG
ncbi:hypothetical protein [Gracilibacillus xinjiangensis]|uniref:Uncharacterized protein n=1 Tax=Gracilibacillus xinjiangensis TaxID=1193282 RepID=A0ABV8X0P3_9BACI